MGVKIRNLDEVLIQGQVGGGTVGAVADNDVFSMMVPISGKVKSARAQMGTGTGTFTAVLFRAGSSVGTICAIAATTSGVNATSFTITQVVAGDMIVVTMTSTGSTPTAGAIQFIIQKK